MLWNVEDRGFLPSCDPIIQIPISNYRNTQLIFALENLAHMMPCFLAERRWREEVVYELRQVISKYGSVLVDKLGSPAELERAFLLFSMFANGYLFSYGDTHMQKLPPEISVPLTKVAKMCGRRPGLDHTSYILYNWQKNEDGTIEPLVTFTDSNTEKKLIESFVNQAFDVAEMINNRKADNYLARWKTTLEKIVEHVRKVRSEMNSHEFEVIGEYYNDPPGFECNPFAQMPLFSMLYRMFLATEKDLLLQKAETDISEYRPNGHNQFIAGLNPLANLIVDKDSLETYNDCLQLFIDLHHDMFMVKSQGSWGIPRYTALKKCFRQGV